VKRGRGKAFTADTAQNAEWANREAISVGFAFSAVRSDDLGRPGG
jgi:hypothetical protein